MGRPLVFGKSEIRYARHIQLRNPRPVVSSELCPGTLFAIELFPFYLDRGLETKVHRRTAEHPHAQAVRNHRLFARKRRLGDFAFLAYVDGAFPNVAGRDRRSARLFSVPF